MKVQDILFFMVFIFLLYKGSSKLSVVMGILSFAMSIPLFAMWVFFTAERLTWYAVAFFLLAVTQFLIGRKKGE